MENILDLAANDLKEKYNPHTIILYGSYAREDATDLSDIDIACFWDRPDEIKDARLFHKTFLDAWIYPTSFLDTVPEEALRFSDGKVLHDAKGLGVEYLNRVKEKLHVGREPMSDADKAHIREWVKKMLERAHNGSLDGNYRRNWLQHDLLSIYFDFRGLWFLGSKKSFAYLQKHDQKVYELFEQTYRDPLNLELLSLLAKQTVCI